MKIVVNTRLLLTNKLDGIGWFTYETLKRITQQHPEHDFYFLFDRPYSDKFIFSKNITPIVIGPQARHPFLFYGWFEFSVTAALKKIKPDLFLSPDGFLSLKTTIPQLAVIHDLNFVHYPNDLPFLVRKYYNYFFPKFAQKATRIATVSEYSKQDIIKTYKIAENKIDVVYNGASAIYQPVLEDIKQQTRKKYTLGCEYFLFVGSLHPRKNIVRLLKAFEEFKKKTSSAVKLVLAGNKMWWTDEMETTLSNLSFKHDVIFTGRLESEELHYVYASALALTYVTYFEGFGIPIIEAMNCDTPVITSNITSMPEVAGDAAILVDPFSVSAISHAMLEIYSSPSKRSELIEKAKIQRQKFSWDLTAKKLWESILKT